MKIIIVVGIILLTCVSSSFAQFGKIKIKKPKITAASKSKPSTAKSSEPESKSSEPSTTTKSSSSDNEGRTSVGAPTRRSELPSYETYSKAKMNMKYASSAMDESSWKSSPDKDQQEKVLKYLDKYKENLDLLNQDPAEKDRAYLKEFNETYPVLKKKCTDDLVKYEIYSKRVKKLATYSRWVSLGSDFNDDKFKPSYKDYYEFIEIYKTEHPTKFTDDYTQKSVLMVNDYFEVKIYEKVDALDKKVTAIIKNTHKLNSRQEEAYLLGAEGFLKKLNAPIKVLEEYKSIYLKDHTSANALEVKINKEKSMLEAYINSGKLAAHKAKYAQEIIDNRRLTKEMSDSEIEAFAKKNLPAEYGKILRVTISSPDWYVNKNLYIPLNKNVGINFATKKEDGKCHLIHAIIRRDYEGGGVYGSWKLISPGSVGEINCDNVNK